jgi:hypothetical protein
MLPARRRQKPEAGPVNTDRLLFSWRKPTGGLSVKPIAHMLKEKSAQHSDEEKIGRLDASPAAPEALVTIRIAVDGPTPSVVVEAVFIGAEPPC